MIELKPFRFLTIQVMEVKCAEIVKSDQFSAERTARFPRCVNLRYDKGWHEALSQRALFELCAAGSRGAAAADPRLLVLQIPHFAEGKQRLVT